MCYEKPMTANLNGSGIAWHGNKQDHHMGKRIDSKSILSNENHWLDCNCQSQKKKKIIGTTTTTIATITETKMRLSSHCQLYFCQWRKETHKWKQSKKIKNCYEYSCICLLHWDLKLLLLTTIGSPGHIFNGIHCSHKSFKPVQFSSVVIII